MNKGHGVARIPVFCIEDYIVYYFCIKELEEIISGNRTDHIFGGWTLGGKLRKLEVIDVECDTGFSSARYGRLDGEDINDQKSFFRNHGETFPSGSKGGSRVRL